MSPFASLHINVSLCIMYLIVSVFTILSTFNNMKVFWITLLAIIMITATENIQPLNHAIIKSLIMFRMSNPSIMHSSLPKVGQIQLIKHFSNYGQEIIFDPFKYNLHDFLVIFTELEDYEHNKYPETQVPILGKFYILEN